MRRGIAWLDPEQTFVVPGLEPGIQADSVAGAILGSSSGMMMRINPISIDRTRI
jgi:hypothetical protein